MAIQPISLPQSAGLVYGSGDVRHFSPGDAQDVPSLQNPTRHLAQRDNALAEKVNELVTVVNNQEQFVPLPLVRTILSPMDETIVANYRIPAGFESRVLNAIIASSPASADIELNVYYNTTFGGVTGTAVVTTATEYSGGVSFYQEGEFVIGLKNKTGYTLELSASILLTLRPVGAEGGLLVASVVKGDKGDPGPTGPRGTQGVPGTGGAGSPGMRWMGAWVGSSNYLVNDVVSYPLYGSLTSSFIAVQNATGGQTPQDSYLNNAGYWDVVALGFAGTGGPVGPSGGAPFYVTRVVNGTFVTHADYIGVSYDAFYNSSAAPTPSQDHVYSFMETAVVDTSGTDGLATLFKSSTLAFIGHADVQLPDRACGARCDYSTTNIMCSVATNGTSVVYNGTTPGILLATSLTGTSFMLWSTGSVAVTLGLFGAQRIVP